MKAKRIFALTLMIILLLTAATQITPISAKEQAEFSLNFILNSDGNQVVMANHNDIITISFIIERADANTVYTTNGFQNYIHYDRSFFEFVEDSIVCNDTGSASAKKQNSITYGEIIQCQNMGKTYGNRFVFCTFQLKVIGTSGSGMVYCGEVQAFDSKHQKVTVNTKNLQVLIDVGCNHENKTKVDEKISDCSDKGWEAYYKCNNCDALFDATGTNLIPEIPYFDEVHAFKDTLSCDELGHWYECESCGEKSQYSSHNGGTATCTKLAVCSVCGQEYGTVNPNNHTGETIVKNDKKPNLILQGYTGDIHCADCGALLENGELIPTTTIDLSIILLILLLIIVVVLFPPAFILVVIILLVMLLLCI